MRTKMVLNLVKNSETDEQSAFPNGFGIYCSAAFVPEQFKLQR
jgi:hypothetical protein